MAVGLQLARLRDAHVQMISVLYLDMVGGVALALTVSLPCQCEQVQ